MPQGFPNNPAVNDTALLNGSQYKWDGVAWRKTAASTASADLTSYATIAYSDEEDRNKISEAIMAQAGQGNAPLGLISTLNMIYYDWGDGSTTIQTGTDEVHTYADYGWYLIKVMWGEPIKKVGQVKLAFWHLVDDTGVQQISSMTDTSSNPTIYVENGMELQVFNTFSAVGTPEINLHDDSIPHYDTHISGAYPFYAEKMIVDGIDTAVSTNATNIATNTTDIATITAAMSTDTERLAAVTALTTAYDAADTTLEGLLTTAIAGKVSKSGDTMTGSLGIGTSSPTSGHKLHVLGDSGQHAKIKVESTTATGQAELYLTANSAGGSLINLGDESSSNIGRIAYYHTDNAMRFETNNAERMRIDSSGKVGIGTSSPASELEINGTHTTNVTNEATLVSGTSLTINGNSGEGTDTLRMGAMANGTGAYFIDVSNGSGTANYNLLINPFNTGNVGIGTTSPTSKLEVAGTMTATSVKVGSWTVTDTGGELMFNNGTNRMKLDASGNLTVTGDITAFGSV